MDFAVVFCLLLAISMPLVFVISMMAYACIYGVSVKAAFICIFKAWMEPL